MNDTEIEAQLPAPGFWTCERLSKLPTSAFSAYSPDDLKDRLLALHSGVGINESELNRFRAAVAFLVIAQMHAGVAPRWSGLIDAAGCDDLLLQILQHDREFIDLVWLKMLARKDESMPELLWSVIDILKTKEWSRRVKKQAKLDLIGFKDYWKTCGCCYLIHPLSKWMIENGDAQREKDEAKIIRSKSAHTSSLDMARIAHDAAFKLFCVRLGSLGFERPRWARGADVHGWTGRKIDEDNLRKVAGKWMQKAKLELRF